MQRETGKIEQTDLSGGRIRSDRGIFLRFRWCDASFEPSAAGHDSRVSFSVRQTELGRSATSVRLDVATEPAPRGYTR